MTLGLRPPKEIKMTNTDPYLGRDSPWRAVTRRSVDVWTVARLTESTSVDVQPMPLTLPRRPRNLPSHDSGHSLPLAA